MSDPAFLADGSGIAPHIPLAKVRKVGLEMCIRDRAQDVNEKPTEVQISIGFFHMSVSVVVTLPARVFAAPPAWEDRS